MTQPTIISLEGNIGAGKSTFLEHLEKNIGKNSGWIFLREPVHIWEQIKDENGETVLANFYKNPEKYAFAFQVMAYTTRYQELKRVVDENPNCKGVICERSLEADKYIFAKMLHSDGLIDKLMYNIYERYFSVYEGNFKLDGVIHIHADPDVCFERIVKRSRTGESTISLDYLKKCDEFHHNWLMNTETPVLRLDVNLDVDVESTTSFEQWLKQSQNFIELLIQKNDHSMIQNESNP